MGTTKLNIGKIPISKGEYQEGTAYQRLNQVTMLGSTYQSKIDDNTSAPAQMGADGAVENINTDKWLCIAVGNVSAAKKVVYNNETSGLEAGNVQEAIDEVGSKVSDLSSDLNTKFDSLQETSDDLRNNNSITFNAVDKIIELPTSYGVLKKQYLHSSSSTTAINDAARLYCVYIDGACKIVCSNLANMQDGYGTRCWAAYSEREINDAYFISEFSDPKITPIRKGVSCELNIPETVKMVCFSSLADTEPTIKVTKLYEATKISGDIENNSLEITLLFSVY